MKIETQPVTMDLKPRIDALRARYGHTAASHAFASLFVWREDMGLSVHLEEDLFAVQCLWRGANAWFFPVGGPDAVRGFLTRALRGPELRLYYVREEDKVLLEREFPGRFRFTLRPGDGEYLYDRAGQNDLTGGRFVRVRNDLHRIQRGRALRWAPIGPENLDAARQVCRDWAHRLPSPEGLRDDAACALLLDHWEALDARGGLVCVDGVPRSVTAGYPLSGDTFDLSLSKQNARLSGLSVYSRWMLIRSLPERYTLLNGEEDLGLEGLQRMKLLMRPVGRVEMYEGRS